MSERKRLYRSEEGTVLNQTSKGTPVRSAVDPYRDPHENVPMFLRDTVGHETSEWHRGESIPPNPAKIKLANAGIFT
jgi:hypothetical protein